MPTIKYLLLTALSALIISKSWTQEFRVPMTTNVRVADETSRKSGVIKRTEPISLPMVETFHYYSETSLPSDEWWIDGQAYINNHYTNNHLNKGIATLDMLDANGQPYENLDPWLNRLCDSLTTYDINMSMYSPSDSVYLSFDYLAGGLGFFPKPGDSLMVYFKDSVNGWTRVSQILPSASGAHWQTLMIPITNIHYFYSQFQFRIINKGTIGYSGTHWHIDNVILDKDRRHNDVIQPNLAFNLQPNSFFKDFTSMPWKHYNTDRNAFTTDSLHYALRYRHGFSGMESTLVNYEARLNGTTLLSSSNQPIDVIENTNTSGGFSNFNPSLIPTLTGEENTLDITFSLTPPSDDAFPEDNDITQKHVFSNYLAYDDGSAEQAYFLNLSPGLRGEVAIEYACYVPDTLAGLQIQFLPQVPYGSDKEFYIKIYKDIEVGGSSGTVIYEQGGNFPVYTRDNDGWVLYSFNDVVPLSTGVFYVSLMMPASGMSDSLMIGLDVNRRGGNHRYYNVLDVWESSLLDGALMVRPVFSKHNLSTETHNPQSSLSIYPNPVDDNLYVKNEGQIEKVSYEIVDIHGRIVKSGKCENENIDVNHLLPGQYILKLSVDNHLQLQEKFIKL